MVSLKSMNVISLTNAQLAFGHVALLDHAEFSLDEGERVGLIGRNGAGKSSILKVITGNSNLDDGCIAIKNGIRIAYVNQEPYFEPKMSIFDAVASGMGTAWKLLNEYDVITSQLGGGNDKVNIELMQKLQNKLDDMGAWDLANKVEIILNRFSLDKNLLIVEL
jgi:ATP-binding cassette subfamily F protein uup